LDHAGGHSIKNTTTVGIRSCNQAGPKAWHVRIRHRSAMYLKSICIFLLLSAFGSAQNYRFTTIAGFGTFGGDGWPATSALLNPGPVAVAADGTLYVSDPGNHRIRKIDRAGTITTLIGNGSGAFSGDGGLASVAQMSSSSSLAIDSSGNLYFSDDSNLRIREVTAGGNVKTIAGNGTCGTVAAGMLAVQAPLCDVDSVGVDSQGRVFFGSAGQIWMVAADGSLVLIAGNGGFGNKGDGGLATAAEIGYPGSVAIDQNGIIYIADLYNFVIRKITSDNKIAQVVKISDTSATAAQLALDSTGELFYVTGRNQVFKLSKERRYR
jgi:sugar lactone lactonase YvrE